MSDYLFDKSGEPEPDVERLEALLRPMAYAGAPPRLPRVRSRRALVVTAGLLAAAAAIALVVASRWRAHPPSGTQLAKTAPSVAPGARGEPPAPSWAARIDGADTRVAVGAWLDSGARAIELRVAGIGTVTLAPGTRARILETSPERHRLQLERGALVAAITAPPRRFVVETPHARVIDLGCAFSLTVDDAGRGRVVVTGGAVALSDGAREVPVPAGAACDIGERGPIAPYASDAPVELRAALWAWAQDPTRLPALLAAARPRDRLTLRALPAGPGERALIDARLAELDAPERAAPRPRHHSTNAASPSSHASSHAASHGKPAGSSAPAANRKPARPGDPARKHDATQIHHDALEGLERSIP